MSIDKVGLEFILLRNFTRRFSVRRLEQFGSPIASPISELELPINSIYHFLSEEATVWGPSQFDELLTKSAPTGARVRTITEYKGNDIIGRPKHITSNLNRELTAYHRLNVKMRKFHEKTDIKVLTSNEKILLIENYAPLLPTYTYPSKIMAWYERWHNTINTVVATLDEDTEEFGRQNYIIVDLPNTIPSINELNRAAKQRDKITLKNIRTNDVLFFLELWTWLGDTQDRSVFSQLSNTQLRRVNVIIRNAGFFVNINLGELQYWRKNSEGIGQVSPKQMQQRLYKTYIDFSKRTGESAGAQEAAGDGASFQFSPEDKDQDIDESPQTAQQFTDEIEDTKVQILEFDDNFDVSEDEAIVLNEAAASTDTERKVNYEKAITPEEGVLNACDKLIDYGLLTSKELHYVKENADAYKHIPNPFGRGTIGDNLEVTTEDLALPNKTLLANSPVIKASPGADASSIIDYDKKYINKVLHKDILGMAVSYQKAGVLVKDYAVRPVVDAAGGVLLHTLKVQPVGGEPSTIHYETPIIDDQGYWTNNNVRYTMRKQCVDLPIRKTAPDKVALTSGYGKNFITRSSYASADYYGWLAKRITLIGANNKDLSITNVINADMFYREVRLPRDYTSLSMHISSFTAGDVVYNFDYRHVLSTYSKEDVKQFQKEEIVPIGKSSTATYFMGMDNIIYKRDKKGMSNIGTLPEVLGIDTTKAPRDYTVMSIMRKDIPLGLILSYYFGLEGLLKKLGIKYTLAERTDRVAKGDYDMIIATSNNKILINFENAEQDLIISGLNPYLKVIANYATRELNSTDVYLNLIQKDGLNARYLNELDLMRDMYVDPITLRMLKKMKEPETFIGLLFRANEMLTYDEHPEESDFDEMHIYAQHRIALAVYTEVVRSVRNYRNTPGQRKKLEMPRREVWNNIDGDGSVLLAADTNPIQSMREKYVVTKGGTGGRSRQSMVKHTRKFTDSDIGVVANDTVDSGDVGITYYLADNPRLADLDGAKDQTFKRKDLQINSLLSSVEMVAPFVLNDDDKRRNFIAIQHHATTFARGYKVPNVMTGSEILVAHKCGPTHSQISEAEGVVKKVTKSGITVEYNQDGEVYTKSYPLGRTFGQYEGATYPHELETMWKAGDSVRKDDVITYNSHFFTPDPMNHGQVIWMSGTEGNILFIEGTDSWEDSCAISERLSGRCGTSVTHIRDIRVKDRQAIHGLVKVGDHVEPSTILCTIEDELTANTSLFNEESMSTLSRYSAQTPKAKYVGKVEKIEIFYNSDYEDMTPSVREVAMMGDRERAVAAKNSPVPMADNCVVDSTLRIDGNPVELGDIAIRVYITHDTNTIGGDKLVFFNQLKATIRRVMSGVNEAADGTPIDGIFGRVSVDNRIVVAVYKSASTHKLAQLYSKELTAILEE